MIPCSRTDPRCLSDKVIMFHEFEVAEASTSPVHRCQTQEIRPLRTKTADPLMMLSANDSAHSVSPTSVVPTSGSSASAQETNSVSPQMEIRSKILLGVHD